MKKLIFVGYNLSEERLTKESLVSGEIKNANYLMHALKDEGVNILPISINLTKNENTKHRIEKSSAKGVFRWLKESKKINQIISENLDEGDVLYLTIPSYLPFLKISKKTKVIITAHGTYWPELLADLKYESSLVSKMLHLGNGLAQLTIDKLSFKRANFLHSVSDFQVKEMLKTYGASSSKIISIRNGTNFVNSEGNRDFDFIWVGRIAKKKNLKLFVDFVNRIGAEKVCICSGNDYFAIDEKSKELLSSLDSDNRFVIKKDIPDEELNQLMNESKCLVVSSTGYESIPTVIFEGLASGCYVLSPESWGVNEVEGDGLIKYNEGSLDSMIKEYNMFIENESEINPCIYDSVRWVSRAKLFVSKFEL